MDTAGAHRDPPASNCWQGKGEGRAGDWEKEHPREAMEEKLMKRPA